MGTELIDDLDAGNVLFKRYWGGTDDGVMYQITEKNAVVKYVNLSQMDMLRLCGSFINSLIGGDLDD